jgi:hypothetical protein
MLGKYTQDGITLIAFGAAFIDYGLKIVDEHDDEIVYFYSPHYLSSDSYGIKPAERYDDWEEAEEAAQRGENDAFTQWDSEDWSDRLEYEFDEIVETCLGMMPKEVHHKWKENVLPFVKKTHEADGIVDHPARRESFNNYVDMLNKDRRITESLASNIEHPEEA